MLKESRVSAFVWSSYHSKGQSAAVRTYYLAKALLLVLTSNTGSKLDVKSFIMWGSISTENGSAQQ
jgi:hypothetical protein